MTAINSSGTLLLDTNLLLLLFIGGKDVSLIKKARTLSAYTEEDYELLREFAELNRFTSLLTTPHIITEVSNLLGKERDDITRVGREATAEFLARCSERTDSSAQLASNPEFRRLGITDVAIAVAASTPAFILTADLPLYVYCASSGLDVANFNHPPASGKKSARSDPSTRGPNRGP
ncbi:hypothetical protein [Synechococcus sp. BA-132 BA5]|uniref:hypothetical protein n=1 Tax=Synechococcus sp. BA-132 BA5 TaxID=3110252 RepID=UPI002B215065|nr:hypothetical protein [Synechococcus sp. BA-132 BA5]MEA5415096.1 hypothetical protein [Synechococcus sp. BA-132 BA5]